MAIIQELTFEVNTNNHAPWYDSTVVRSTADAQSGVASLLVTQTAAFAGVNLNNFPYFPGCVEGSEYEISCWAREAGPTMPNITWSIRFYDTLGTEIDSTSLVIPRSTVWQRHSITFLMPSPAARVGWTFATTTGNGSSWYIDNLIIEDYVSNPPDPQSAGGHNSNAMAEMGVF